MTHRSFYTPQLLHTEAFTHNSFDTQKLLHTKAFTRRSFYTQKLLLTDASTHRSFYTQKFLHTAALTHRCFYTQKLLHTAALTHRCFYTQMLLHTEAFTHRSFDAQMLLHTHTLALFLSRPRSATTPKAHTKCLYAPNGYGRRACRRQLNRVVPKYCWVSFNFFHTLSIPCRSSAALDISSSSHAVRFDSCFNCLSVSLHGQVIPPKHKF